MSGYRSLQSRLEKLESTVSKRGGDMPCVYVAIVESDGTHAPMAGLLGDGKAYARQDGEADEAFLTRVRADCATRRRQDGRPGVIWIHPLDTADMAL